MSKVSRVSTGLAAMITVALLGMALYGVMERGPAAATSGSINSLGAWFRSFGATLPAGIVGGNGRVEATEVQVATKIPGRVAAVLVHEGDNVSAGQALAQMDTRVLDAQLRAAQAEVVRARAVKDQDLAQLAQNKSQAAFAESEFQRAAVLFKAGSVSRQQLDGATNARTSAAAAINAVAATIAQADAAINAAVAQADSLQTEIDDSRLTAPLDGRVLYRLAEPGEVMAPGGRILTLIDLHDMHMTIFLPEEQAGRIRIGTEARIVVDAFPKNPVSATVAFVAPEAQFTPKEVETAEERQKMMFRLKLAARADYGALAKPGMLGMGYVRLDETAQWPTTLR